MTEYLSPRLGLWTLLLLLLIVAGAGLYPGTWSTWAGFLPAWNVSSPATLANVATTPDLWRGTAIGAMAPAQPLLLLGLSPQTTVNLVMLSCLALGALATYVWLAPLFGDRGAGLAGAVWLLLPMHLSAVFTRGAMDELIVLALLPIALAGLRALAAQNSLLGAGVAVIAMLWMWRSQAGLAVAATLLLVIYSALVLRHRLALLTAVVAAAAGFFTIVGLLNVQGPPVVPFGDQAITLYGLLRTGAVAGEPLQLGVMALGLAALAIFGLSAGDTLADAEGRRLLWFAVGAVTVGVLLALPWVQPLWQATRADRLFTYPWQPLLVTGPLLAALAGAVPALFSEWRRTPLWSATILALLIYAQFALTPTYMAQNDASPPIAIVGENDLAIMQATVAIDAAEGTSATGATLALRWQVLRPLPFDDNLFFQAVMEPDASGEAQVVAQMDVQPMTDAPATSWQRGQILSGSYTLPLPADVDPASLTFYAGLYDWRDGTRRPISLGPTAAPVGKVDKLVLRGE